MDYEHLKVEGNPNEGSEDVQTNWLSWCRLCAKRQLSLQESSSIFVETEAGKFSSELATSIGKYFWVNIKADDEISQCLCLECKQLLEELVTFTERVNKVQTLFCLLQNINPTTIAQANKLRKQCGLIDEGWQHIIKQPSKLLDSPKPLLIDKEIQTDILNALNNEKEREVANQEFIETEELMALSPKSRKNEEQVFEYVLHADNDVEYMESNEYTADSNNMIDEEKKPMLQEATEEEIEESNLVHQLKDKISDDDCDDSEYKEIKGYKIISEEDELEVEYEDSSQTLEQENYDETEHSIEMLDEEDDDEFINLNENQSDTAIKTLGLMKGKRGRPFGAKNSDTSVYRFECKECKRTYKSPNIFRRHMSSIHNIEVDDMPEFKSMSNTCTICNKPFTTRSSLKLHMRNHLPDEEKYNIPCPYCDRKFSQVGAMRQHVNGIHHQMKPFICDQCGRACKTMAALNEHQLVHTNECPFECEVCHKRFKNKPRLKSHLDTHNKSAYKCLDCGLVLNTKRTLLQHRLVHSDEKRFKCEFCDAAFKRSKALKNHLILHSGLRPYKCSFCNKSFSNGSNCRAHKKRTHPRELAEEEANGKEPERVPIPKLEELKSAKSALVQPRKIKRHAGGLPNQLRKLLQSSEKSRQEDCNDYEDGDGTENYETVPDFHYEILKSEVDDTESLVDNPGEECEETVIYEIIDEI